MTDVRPSIDAALAAFGVPASVWMPDDLNGSPIVTSILWLASPAEAQPYGIDFRRAAPRRVAVLRRTDVPTFARGIVIEAASPDDTSGPQRWKVDELDHVQEHDAWRVLVIPTT